MKEEFKLEKNWYFRIYGSDVIDFSKGASVIREFDVNESYPAQIPGNIYTDLIANKIIDDPYYGDNEIRLQWVSESDWEYFTEFDLPGSIDIKRSIELVFEGLDTIASIFLNGTRLGDVENMFRTYRYDVSNSIKKKGNRLHIRFTSPYRYARILEEKFGKLPVALNSERVYIRKAQYSFGWDWGPSFAGAGIWRSVCIKQKNDAEIERVLFSTVRLGANYASVQVNVYFDREISKKYRIAVKMDDKEQLFEKKSDTDTGRLTSLRFKIRNPQLWYPIGMGDQFLYNLSVCLYNEDEVLLDEKKLKVGIRTVTLNTSGMSEINGSAGQSGNNDFSFIVNNKRVFIKGANWIPADLFLANISYDKYRSLLLLAQKAGMNMVRVWGGGVYENDSFYEICDELGLLVWQDFMFACASYPENPELIENIKAEVDDNVKRLQYHPSIAIWCGNNENEWIWFQEQNKPIEKMSGFRIYHKLIPRILRELDASRPYVPSTPFGLDEDPNSQLSGNRHQWDIWSRWIDYKYVISDNSLFVTEFGFQSPANYYTLKTALPKQERTVQSRLFEFHNKQVEGNERIIRFMAGHLPVNTSFKDYIYLAQLNHGFAMKQCLEHWRLRFPMTNGAVIWQLNDCWPVTSWSLVDSEIIPKLSWYFVKNAFAATGIYFITRKNSLNIAVLNESQTPLRGYWEIKLINLPKGNVELLEEGIVKLSALDYLTEIISYPLSSFNTDKNIIIASLFSGEGTLISRNYYNFGEWKHLSLPKPAIKLIMHDKKDGNFTLIADKPAFFVSLYMNNTVFSDNSFILLPDEEYSVSTDRYDRNEKKKKSPALYCLNDYL